MRPERVVIGATEAAASSDRFNVVRCGVADVMVLGAGLHVSLTLGSGRRIAVVAKNLGGSVPRPGEAVDIGFGADDCIILPAER